MWNVLAGTLVIRIDCGFSLTKATLVGAAISDIKLPPQPNGVSPAIPDVYSWPMHCDSDHKLTSEITITVRQEDGSAYSGFRAELVTKKVSPALWKQWSAVEDPLFNRNIPPNLTKPDATQPELVQAVRVFAPESILARSNIVDMDAAEAMRLTLRSSHGLPVTQDQGTDFAPTLFQDVDAKGTIVTDGTTRWKDFAKLWNPQLDPVQANKPETKTRTVERATIVDEIATALEWNIRPAAQMAKNVEPLSDAAKIQARKTLMLVNTAMTANVPRVLSNGRTDWQLVADQPLAMVDDLAEYFPALPQVCV